MAPGQKCSGAFLMLKAIKREPRELPWYPEWTKHAECAKMSPVLADHFFFEYGNNVRIIDKAKAICAQCPVIHLCREQNRYVPFGIFFGMTALERWRWNGFKGYPQSNKVGWNSGLNELAKRMTISKANESN